MSKKSFLTILCLTFCCAFWTTIEAQTTTTTQTIDVKVQQTHAKFLGKTKPLRDLAPLSPADPKKKAIEKKNKKREVVNFIGRDKRDHMNSPNKSVGPDPVRQKDFGTTNHNPIFPVEPLVDIVGIGTGSPTDPSGDIGQDYYIQAVNVTDFRVYDKQGNPVTNTIAMNTLWSSIGFSSAGDPIVLYDQEVNRWILTEFPNGNELLMAISETSDPTGSWMAYNFSTPNFPDYPKYSVWNNSYVVTTNEQGNGVLPSYFINRQDMLDGVNNPRIQRIEMPGIPGGPGFFVSTPVDWSGLIPPAANADPMILRLNDDAWSANNQDFIDIFSTVIDWDNPSNTVVTETNIPTADYDTDACAAPGFGFACIPQMNGGGIDGLPQTIMNQVHYRNFSSHESMVLNFLVNSNTPADIIAGIRWIEMRRVPGGVWEVYQEGTFAPDDGLHRFNGTMAMDGSGNIALAYNISGPNSFPGIRYTGRRSSDPLGEMTITEYNVVEGASANPGNRWGDYAHMSIDPINDRTFWFTTEYRANNTTRTRIVAYEFDRDSIDIGVSALITPVSSPDLTNAETVQIEVKNFGLDSQMVNNVGFIFENGTEVLEAANVLLPPDSTFLYTFTSATVDMSVIADYDFKLFTTLATDALIANDTLRRTVSKVTRNDAGITGVTGLDFSSTCDLEVPVQFTLTNFGFDPLISANILVTIGGITVTTIPWTGNLASGESTNISVTLTGFAPGTNTITATSSSPNGQVDEDMNNDSFSRDLDYIDPGAAIDVLLTINFDQFSNETTWELLDVDDNVLYSGGPYPRPQWQFETYTESWCLDTSACYTFNISDAYGDGICCGFGEGSYNLTLDNGAELVVGDGQFGTGESTNFCPIPTCLLVGDIDITPESTAGAGDGTIMITAMDGVGPFNYSIDGGQTFQTSNVFDGLEGGDYDIVIQDIAECIFEQTVQLATCALEITADVTNEITGTSTGSIEVDAANGQGTVQFNIDGGIFSNNSTFTNLSAGEYTIMARDEAGCEVTLDVIVDMETSINEITFGTSIEVLPNPTNGNFRINVKGLDRSDVYLPFQIFDISGKLIQERSLVKYDDVYTSEVSLVAYPSGTYLIRFLDENMNRLVKIIRN